MSTSTHGRSVTSRSRPNRTQAPLPLVPYLYACFLRASETGEPVQRPLIFDYQYDATVRDIDDQYLLGRDLLIAPVVEPGITGRQVYLPGGDWYDWHGGELVGGRRF